VLSLLSGYSTLEWLDEYQSRESVLEVLIMAYELFSKVNVWHNVRPMLKRFSLCLCSECVAPKLFSVYNSRPVGALPNCPPTPTIFPASQAR
jgi:hypothetical protein